MSEVTQLLAQIGLGDATAPEKLLPLLYDELRSLAACKLAHENPGQTLQATALVHEAYVRLVGGEQPQEWNSRGHFFVAAAEAMRRILIENARRKAHRRRLLARRRVDLNFTAGICPDGDHADELLEMDAALDALAAADPKKAAIVQLRYFAGLSWDEIARCRGISTATAKRRWLVARAWLYKAMTAGIPSDSASNREL